MSNVPVAADPFSAAPGRTESRVVCFGGATVDRKYRAIKPLIAGTSNPVAGTRTFGGVARNVAETLSRLAVKVSLVTAIGQDEAGEALMAHLAERGVDTSCSVRVAGRTTAEYVAVLAQDGSLTMGLADMAVLDRIGPAEIERAGDQLSQAQWIFADCNLQPETLVALARRRARGTARLAVDAVSTPKVKRLPADLSVIDLLFLNHDEAQGLLGLPAGPQDALAALGRRGARCVVLTQGAQGALLLEAGRITPVPAAHARKIDETGAGDALVAGTIAALAGGRGMLEALRVGSAVAALTVESEASVRPDLTPRLVAAALHRSSMSPGESA